MSETIRIGLEIVQEAVEVRRAITERYTTYKVLSEIVQFAAMVEHADFKNACDAIYYLGGGWPTENSKGRMEKLLDNFSGMYKILTLIGNGDLVTEHLAKKGIRVVDDSPIVDLPLSEEEVKFLNEQLGMATFEFKTPTCLSELVAACVNEAQVLQKFICENADLIKDELKPSAKAALQVEDEEYDRIVFLTKNVDAPAKVVKKKNAIAGSVDQFKTVARTQL